MEAKTEASYIKVMERFQMKFPEVKPLVIITDFETALRNVFLYIYPEAQIFSCWFHYVIKDSFNYTFSLKKKK